MKLTRLTLLLTVLLLIVSSVPAQRETVDKIVAVVGNEVILASELATQVQMYVFQTGQQPKNETDLQKIQKDILDQMVYDKLFLLEARQDTTINVRPEEIEMALDEQIAKISSNFESDEAFMAALANEGLTVRTLRKQYESEIENQLLKNRLIQAKLYTVSVSKHEVEEFFKNYQDSIPSQPEAVKLAHMLLEFKASQVVEDSVKDLAAELRQKILDGADFATISTQYSSLGAGTNGGDLGFIRREDVVPEFARAAFSLGVGDISGVIRTQFGYHVIKCEDVKEDRMHLRHILLAVQPTKEDTLNTSKLADSLLNETRLHNNFDELAKAFSDDDDTRASGGELGWFATANLPPEFAAEVKGWHTPGEYRGPIPSRFGLHLLKLLDYRPAKQYKLDEDYDQVKELARQEKTGKMIDKWIEKIKEKTYIDYRLENADR
ncbi:MAG: peptidylprolyl isomerase [Candidatus Zixiibacteriota bacterium]